MEKEIQMKFVCRMISLLLLSELRKETEQDREVAYDYHFYNKSIKVVKVT